MRFKKVNKMSFCVLFVLMSDHLEKPENLSCLAVQENTHISPIFSCVWEPVGRQTISVSTTYMLHVKVIS